MAKIGMGRWPLVALGVALVALFVTFAALRDVASRLDTPRDTAAREATAPLQLASAFSPGPHLGDLRSLFLQASEEEPEEEISEITTGSSSGGRVTTGDSVTIEERVKITGEGAVRVSTSVSTDERTEPRRKRQRRSKDDGSSGSGICDMPGIRC